MADLIDVTLDQNNNTDTAQTTQTTSSSADTQDTQTVKYKRQQGEDRQRAKIIGQGLANVRDVQADQVGTREFAIVDSKAMLADQYVREFSRAKSALAMLEFQTDPTAPVN